MCAKYVIWQKYAFSICRNLSWAQLYLVSWGLDKLLSFACQRHRWVLQVGKHDISTVSQLKYLDIVWDLGEGHDLWQLHKSQINWINSILPPVSKWFSETWSNFDDLKTNYLHIVKRFTPKKLGIYLWSKVVCLFCFVLMRSTELGCFRSASWCLWKALYEEGCMGLVPWRLDLQCKSSWILNDFFTEN
jgi:hypothetical protein